MKKFELTVGDSDGEACWEEALLQEKPAAVKKELALVKLLYRLPPTCSKTWCADEGIGVNALHSMQMMSWMRALVWLPCEFGNM